MLPDEIKLDLSGDRFRVHYQIKGDEALARNVGEAICVEQTVEFPRNLLPKGDIDSQVVGQIESMSQTDENHWTVVISYPIEVVGSDVGQLINVVYGNASILPDIRVTKLDLPPTLLERFQGPRYGREGLRTLLGVKHRPLLCTALKPMGLSAEDLANIAYEFALSGIDIIKDDHGLANQVFAEWEERVRLCASAVQRANEKTGGHSIYMPSALGTTMSLREKALRAKRYGAGGILVPPGIVGFDTVTQLAKDEEFGLPIMSHPSFLGCYVTNSEHGVNHGILFGQLMRLVGVDASVYPNYGGRFSFTREECLDIIEGTGTPLGDISSIFPTPGGGMTLERVPEMLETYGSDVILLIGGDLFRNGQIADNTRKFLDMLNL